MENSGASCRVRTSPRPSVLLAWLRRRPAPVHSAARRARPTLACPCQVSRSPCLQLASKHVRRGTLPACALRFVHGIFSYLARTRSPHARRTASDTLSGAAGQRPAGDDSCSQPRMARDATRGRTALCHSQENSGYVPHELLLRACTLRIFPPGCRRRVHSFSPESTHSAECCPGLPFTRRIKVCALCAHPCLYPHASIVQRSPTPGRQQCERWSTVPVGSNLRPLHMASDDPRFHPQPCATVVPEYTVHEVS